MLGFVPLDTSCFMKGVWRISISLAMVDGCWWFVSTEKDPIGELSRYLCYQFATRFHFAINGGTIFRDDIKICGAPHASGNFCNRHAERDRLQLKPIAHINILPAPILGYCQRSQRQAIAFFRVSVLEGHILKSYTLESGRQSSISMSIPSYDPSPYVRTMPRTLPEVQEYCSDTSYESDEEDDVLFVGIHERQKSTSTTPNSDREKSTLSLSTDSSVSTRVEHSTLSSYRTVAQYTKIKTTHVAPRTNSTRVSEDYWPELFVPCH